MNVDASLKTVKCQAGHTISLGLFLPEINSMSARVLLFLVIPGHLIFFYVIYLVEGPSVPNSKIFVAFYLLAGLIQVRTIVAAAKEHSVVVPCPGLRRWSWGFWTCRTQSPSSRSQVNLFKLKGMI